MCLNEELEFNVYLYYVTYFTKTATNTTSSCTEDTGKL